jgi:hypothetical protein
MIQGYFHGTFRTDITSHLPNSLLTSENPFLPPCAKTEILRRKCRIKVPFISGRRRSHPRGIHGRTRQPKEIPSEDEKIFPTEARDNNDFCGDTFAAQETSDARRDEAQGV